MNDEGAAAESRTMTWPDALALLKTGRVVAVVQLHDLSVTLTTGNGQSYITTEPAIDAIFRAIRDHAPNANSIIVATE